MVDCTKQVRVDNWGIFFLQRLQMFFSKTDYCDMTLQFEGNVQLKVHRLVMNACTEYFQLLEQTCALEDNVIMMPSDLQADVIVPIVNFMYTGMLEFHLSIFDKLYKTAQTMNITILTKLLDAQKQPINSAARSIKKKAAESSNVLTPAKKLTPKSTHHHSDLPAPLPGRKLPVWKRKSIPTPTPSLSSHSVSPIFQTEPKWTGSIDPLSLPDNTPKPTRFEWPDEDLPTLSLMDTSFEEISYTSKPLLTQEEEQRATTSFDDLKHLPNNRSSTSASKKKDSPSLDMEEMKNYVKEQKIRSGLSQEENLAEEIETGEMGQKRKATDQKTKTVVKKVRFDEQDNKTATISIATDGKNPGDLNHEKIVAEILKKYPQLVKKNKNIRLKIMAKGKNATEATKEESVQIRSPKLKVTEIQKPDPKTSKANPTPSKSDTTKAPWRCDRCSTPEEPVDFMLYYLYRKHMTDVHSEKFDPKLCRYCGHKCSKQNLLMYHLYTKHGMKPPTGYHFPKCDQCPFIALSPNILIKHKLRHNKNEIQCVECKLTFTSQVTLTSHIQITGHTGKSEKNNYDCQYCTKRLQTGSNLFAHVRSQHKNEAVRDGIVSIDEMDEMEDYDEEGSKDEYILPEIISDQESCTKKVNIISDVKVQERHEHHNRHQPLTLEPSSEAEALNNVASGIATSLGLVDIVVLNDNQQIFLQPNQQTYSNDQNEQSEFILPELTGRETFVQAQNDVITTDGVITQSMLGSGDIGSTDELVMVLTDHDYGDNQEEINNDNSNIVVLYSHPVDGRQDQFITSQGNLMVNSQGLLEIRNGATITTQANQVVMHPQETHIESIEMIQREIESHHGDLKQEVLYESEDSKSMVPEIQKSQPDQIKETEGLVINRNDSLIQSLTQGEQLELTSPLVSVEEPPNTQETTKNETQKETEEIQKESEEMSVEVGTQVAEADDKEKQDDDIERANEENVENFTRNDELSGQILATSEEKEETLSQVSEPTAPTQEPTKSNVVEDHDGAVNIEKKVSDVSEQSESSPLEENQQASTEESTQETQIPEDNEEGEKKETSQTDTPDEIEQIQKEAQSSEDSCKTETMEIDALPEEKNNEEEKIDNDDTSEEIKDETSEEVKEDINEVEKEENNEVEKEEITQEQELSQSDTSTSQYNDENSQSSQDSRRDDQQENVVTKISILDDWEDTDSQNSDHKEKNKEADETVHKLMDDWEEEEEDDKKEAEG